MAWENNLAMVVLPGGDVLVLDGNWQWSKGRRGATDPGLVDAYLDYANTHARLYEYTAADGQPGAVLADDLAQLSGGKMALRPPWFVEDLSVYQQDDEPPLVIGRPPTDFMPGKEPDLQAAETDQPISRDHENGPDPKNDDVSGPFKDADKAQQLLNRAERDGSHVLNTIMESAVLRLLTLGNPLNAKTLFTDGDRHRLSEALARAMAAGNLLGRAKTLLRFEAAQDHAPPANDIHGWLHGPHAQEIVTFSDNPTNFQRFDEPAEAIKPLPPTRAIEYFRGLVPRLNVDPQHFGAAMQRDAFTAAAATEMEMLVRLKGIILDRLATGTGISTAPAAIQEVLNQAGVSMRNPNYSELLFRTNMMDAYQTGSVQAMQDPEVAEMFPVWQYRGIRDGRQRPSHEAQFDRYFANDTAFAAARDAADGKYSGYNCRCTPQPISKWAWRVLQAQGAEVSGVAA